jgi:hypothetical protein
MTEPLNLTGRLRASAILGGREVVATDKQNWTAAFATETPWDPLLGDAGIVAVTP